MLRKYPMVLTQVPKPMALMPSVSICHAEFSMFRRVKSGTINASQLFFQGSHVFSIFKLRIHACNKNKITTFYRWHPVWQHVSAVKICSIRRSQFQRQMWDQAQNHQKKQIQWTLWDHVIPSAFYSFHLISFNPNFKRPIPAQKWILKQQVRVPLNIPKQRTKITCQCTSPFHHLSRATPKTTRKPFRGHGPYLSAASTWAPAKISCSTTAPRPSRAAQCSAVSPRAPRMRRGRRGCCSCRRETKRIVMECFSVVGQIFLDRS